MDANEHESLNLIADDVRRRKVIVSQNVRLVTSAAMNVSQLFRKRQTGGIGTGMAMTLLARENPGARARCASGQLKPRKTTRMGRPKRRSVPIEKARRRCDAVCTIDPKLDFGEGLTVSAYQAKIKTANDQLSTYNEIGRAHV